MSNLRYFVFSVIADCMTSLICESIRSDILGQISVDFAGPMTCVGEQFA